MKRYQLADSGDDLNDGESVRGAEHKGQAAGDGRANVGALLRASRLRLGEDLGAIADALRINRKYIEAIEEGRIKDLPGTAYAVGFIRAYSQHLGLDSQEVVRRFKTESTCAGDKTELDFPKPIIETGIPGGAVIFVGVAIAVIAYAGWYVSSAKDNFFYDLLAPLPESIAQFASDARSFGSSTDDSTQPSPGSATAATTLPASSSAAPSGTAADTLTVQAPAAQTEQVAATAPSARETPAPAAPAAPAPTAAAAATETPKPVAETAAPAPQPEVVAAAPSQDPAPVSALAAAPIPAPVAGALPAPVAGAVPAPVAGAVPAPVVAADAAPEPSRPPSQPEPVRKAPAREPSVSQTASATPAPAASVPAAPPAAPQVAAAAQPRAYGVSESGSRILITAKGNSWIQVRDDNANEMLLTRMLRAGDSYRVPNRAGLKLMTGDASALEITVDGKPVPALSGASNVRRNIVLDAERLRAGTATAD